MAVCLQHSHIFPITPSIPPRLRLLWNGRRASVYCLFLNLTWLTEHNQSWIECKNVMVKNLFFKHNFSESSNSNFSTLYVQSLFFKSWIHDQMLLPTKDSLETPPPCFFHAFRFRPPGIMLGWQTSRELERLFLIWSCTSASVSGKEITDLRCECSECVIILSQFLL